MDSTSRILGRAAGSNVHGEDATVDVETKELEQHAHETPHEIAAAQARCDEGRKAAEIMLATRAGAGSFFRNNPGIYAQWENDAAFRAGFDGAVRSVSICGPVRC